MITVQPRKNVTEFLNNILFIFQRLNWLSVVDISLVTLIFFALLYWLRDTQAMALLRGVILIVVSLVLLTSLVNLPAFSWLVRNSIPAMLLAIPVIFAPEIRRALERIGRGGMGAVYEALDTALDRRVAVKVIRDELVGNAEAAERFHREARAAAGFTHPFTPRWQLGADYRLASITGTEASGILPAALGTGSSHVFSGQALGNNLWLTNDTLVSNTSLIVAPTYDGLALNVTYVLPLERWRLDGTMVFYVQRDDQSQRQTRTTPSLRAVYRIGKSVNLELPTCTDGCDAP